MKISVIIPVYNEAKVIANCLRSLAKQDYKSVEIIIVDDGSTDTTVSEIRGSIGFIDGQNLLLIKQKHKGPGAARNLGASKATGDVLVFLDADMEFAKDFLKELVFPIQAGKTIGTFSKEEYLLNKDNVWAKYWNLNLGRKADKMHPDNYPDSQHVFRAILKSKFEEAGGFGTNVGYTDDWSLARKLNTLATVTPGAKFYHRNPDSLSGVWTQARWFGKNEFLTGDLIRKFYNLFRYNPIIAIAKGAAGAIKFGEPRFLLFKMVYDCAVFTSVLLSFVGESKYK